MADPNSRLSARTPIPAELLAEFDSSGWFMEATSPFGSVTGYTFTRYLSSKEKKRIAGVNVPVVSVVIVRHAEGPGFWMRVSPDVGGRHYATWDDVLRELMEK